MHGKKTKKMRKDQQQYTKHNMEKLNVTAF